MILINLLPHREERRRQRKRAFFAGLGAAAVAGVAAAVVWYVVLQQMTVAQQARNAFLTAEIKRLELQIKDIAARLVFTVFRDMPDDDGESSDDACFMLATVSNVSETS